MLKYYIPIIMLDLIKDVATRETSQHYEPEERQDATDVPQCVSKQGRLSAGGGGPGLRAWPHPPPPTSNTCEVQRSPSVAVTFQLRNISNQNIASHHSPQPSLWLGNLCNLCNCFYKNISANFLCMPSIWDRDIKIKLSWKWLGTWIWEYAILSAAWWH